MIKIGRAVLLSFDEINLHRRKGVAIWGCAVRFCSIARIGHALGLQHPFRNGAQTLPTCRCANLNQPDLFLAFGISATIFCVGFVLVVSMSQKYVLGAVGSVFWERPAAVLRFSFGNILPLMRRRNVGVEQNLLSGLFAHRNYS